MSDLPFMKKFPREGSWKIDYRKGVLVSCRSGTPVGAVRTVGHVQGALDHLRTMARESGVEATQIRLFRSRNKDDGPGRRPKLFLDLGTLKPLGAGVTARLPEGTAIVSCTLHVRAPRRRKRRLSLQPTRPSVDCAAVRRRASKCLR